MPGRFRWKKLHCAAVAEGTRVPAWVAMRRRPSPPVAVDPPVPAVDAVDWSFHVLEPAGSVHLLYRDPSDPVHRFRVSGPIVRIGDGIGVLFEAVTASGVRFLLCDAPACGIAAQTALSLHARSNGVSATVEVTAEVCRRACEGETLH